ncbi:Uncharacterised protein [uncultured archaeon]|nr:Uncharacterised protein [uncultured archaeon]
MLKFTISNHSQQHWVGKTRVKRTYLVNREYHIIRRCSVDYVLKINGNRR